jgi:hypothetical protein
MNRHALTIARRQPRTDHPLVGWVGVAGFLLACSSGQGGTPEVSVPSGDEAWVASACQPASVDTTGWRRYRVGDVTIHVPPEYSLIGQSSRTYDLRFRGPGGTLSIQLHRNAGYSFDQVNQARRGQNWCRGNLGGYQAEIVSWLEPFRGTRRDTRAGELIISATYNFAARLPATWGGQDQGKWVFVYVGASRLRDARLLRDALHSLSVVRNPVH